MARLLRSSSVNYYNESRHHSSGDDAREKGWLYHRQSSSHGRDDGNLTKGSSRDPKKEREREEENHSIPMSPYVSDLLTLSNCPIGTV